MARLLCSKTCMLPLKELAIPRVEWMASKNSTSEIVSGNFNSDKVDQDEISYNGDVLHFFLE